MGIKNREEFREKYEKVRVEEFPCSTPRDPLVSVCIQTFQHSGFIAQCLDSILAQETDFQFEILVGEDCSTDGTREICLEYAEKHPNQIRLFLHHRENNIAIDGSPTGRFNFTYNLFAARGKYLALCEGDDYWTDPLKLQKQVDVLQEYSEFSACFTNALMIKHGESRGTSYLKQNHDPIFSVEEVIRKGGGLFPTASFMFRNQIEDFPDFFFSAISGDRMLSLLLIDKGPFYFLNEETCIYRIHEGGIFSRNISNDEKRVRISRNNIEILRKFDEFSHQRHSPAIRKAISDLSKKVILKEKRNGNGIPFDLLKNLTLRDWLSCIRNIF